MPTDSDSDSSTPSISLLHETYLAARAVALAVAVAAGLRSVTKEEAAARLGLSHVPAPGLLIPYTNGAASPYYYRLRLNADAPEGSPRFLAQVGDVRPYFPSIVPQETWTGNDPIYFVEGAIKALSLSGAGLPAVGLGGACAGGHDAQLWRSSKELRAHPDLLHRLNLSGRTVVVVFDAGRARNPSVAHGEAMVVQALRNAGATVRIAALPFAPDGSDQGPDDFLHLHGRDALVTVIGAATPGDPLERARLASALEGQARTDALAGLLADRPWVASVALSPPATADAIAVELAKGGLTKATLKTTLTDFKKSVSGRAGREPKARYRFADGRTFEVFYTFDGEKLKELANFIGEVIEEVSRDDGAEVEKLFKIEMTLASGRTLPAKYVKASEFFEMRWPLEIGGVAAVVSAGMGVKDKLREAMQLKSADAVKRTIFSHTGFRNLDGAWRYLHAGGAVGGGNYEVALGPAFDKFRLPDSTDDAPGAVRWSFRLLRCAPMKVTGPLWACVHLAPVAFILGPDFALYLHAVSGEWKSSLAALFQAFFGNYDRKSFPASWESTENFIEQVLFAMKDALTVIDDYAPQQSSFAQRDLERKAQRIIRAIGNRQGRGRMRADTTLRQTRPPRGLVVMTGEDLPPGHSIMARLFVVDVKRAEIDAAAFTAVQQNVGRLPHAMRGYLEWLAPQIPHLMEHLPQAFREAHRRAMQAGHGHLRAPEAVAFLSIGMDLGLQYATEIGAITAAEADTIREESWAAFTAGAQEQGQRVADEDPSAVVFGKLQTILAQGRVVLCEPEQPLESTDRVGVHAIGWRDERYVYLIPDAAREAVVRATTGDGIHVPNVKVIGRALIHRRLLVEVDDGRQTKQLRFGGRPVRVWKLPLSVLGLGEGA
jgi:DNA polymerase-1